MKVEENNEKLGIFERYKLFMCELSIFGEKDENSISKVHVCFLFTFVETTKKQIFHCEQEAHEKLCVTKTSPFIVINL